MTLSDRTQLRVPSQNEQILKLLADGSWLTTRELLVAVPCIVHSRIAEINKRDGDAGAPSYVQLRLVA